MNNEMIFIESFNSINIILLFFSFFSGKKVLGSF